MSRQLLSIRQNDPYAAEVLIREPYRSPNAVPILWEPDRSADVAPSVCINIAMAAVQRLCGRECAPPYMGTREQVPRMNSRLTMSGVQSQFVVQRRNPKAIQVNRSRQVGGSLYRNRYLHEEPSVVLFSLKDCHIYVSEREQKVSKKKWRTRLLKRWWPWWWGPSWRGPSWWGP